MTRELNLLRSSIDNLKQTLDNINKMDEISINKVQINMLIESIKSMQEELKQVSVKDYHIDTQQKPMGVGDSGRRKAFFQCPHCKEPLSVSKR